MRRDVLAEVRDRLGGAGIKLERLITGSEALGGLAEAVRAATLGGRVVLVTDATEMRRRGTDLKSAVVDLLADHPLDRLVLGDPAGRVVADDQTVARAVAAARGAGCVVTVGSGTITDIGKLAAEAAGIPQVAVATAASVNGYADGLAVVLKDGTKRTMTAAWPSVLITDDAIIASAPLRLNRAGIGEMMAMFTAPVDWAAAASVGMADGYRNDVTDLLLARRPILLTAATGVGQGDSDALATLIDLLTLSGLVMGVCGQTAPFSGTEHAISHLLDMAGSEGLHGAQVGVAAVVAACLWQVAIERLADTSDQAPTLAEMEIAVRAAFEHLGSATAEECWTEYRRKFDRWRSRPASSWQADLRVAVAPLLGDPGIMIEALGACGAPRMFSDLGVAPARARWAITNAHLMRSRFSVLDLVLFSGLDVPDLVGEALDRAGRIGGGL